MVVKAILSSQLTTGLTVEFIFLTHHYKERGGVTLLLLNLYQLYFTSEEQLKYFLEKVKGDTSLQEKLKAAADADAVLAIAKEAGYML